MFRDRIDGGKQLAQALSSYQGVPNGIVIGLPRGGVVPAYEVAQALGLPLNVVCPMKIGAPENPEYAIGAITETGKGIFDREAIAFLRVSDHYLSAVVEATKQKAQRYLESFRKKGTPDFQGKTVIVVDDGLATGLTMKAAILSIRSSAPDAQIIVAVPVGPPDSVREIAQIADQVICLEQPEPFFAVGNWYREFNQVSSQEVVKLLEKKSNS